MIPCAPRYQIGSGATVTSHPIEKSPIPNDIPILPEKSDIIEHGEINMPNLSKVLIAENSVNLANSVTFSRKPRIPYVPKIIIQKNVKFCH